jgi:hypothetical protein
MSKTSVLGAPAAEQWFKMRRMSVLPALATASFMFGRRRLITRRGATLLLPKYAPDLAPIGQVFARLKHLRKLHADPGYSNAAPDNVQRAHKFREREKGQQSVARRNY